MIQMNFIKRIAIAGSLSLAAIASHAAGEPGHSHGHDPKYGGVVVETRAGDAEIVVKPDSIRIYITDHGKPIDLFGAKARVTLLNGSQKSEASLVSAGDRLEVLGTFRVAKGTKGIATINLAGKPPATARFEIKQ